MREDEREWIITVADDHLDRLDQIVAELERSGLRVERVLAGIGQVVGCTKLDESAPGQASSDPIRKRFTVVTGVVSVDAVRQYRVSPPDDEVQ